MSVALKAEIRNRMRRQRASLDPLWIRQVSRQIADRVVALPEFKRAEVICCYLSLPGEVDTRAILEAAWRAGKQVAVPAPRDDGEYLPAWIGPDEPLSKGRFGLLEPLTPQWAKPDRFHLAIVPGVAFSPRGGRLGHGRGFYDRLLARLARRLDSRVGIAFACQIVADLPTGETDVGMDVVVTENELYRIT